MSNYDNTNTFTLGRNKFKEEGTKQPDYKGKANIDGVEKEISAWIRVGPDGNKFFSGTIQDPYKKEEKAERSNKRDFSDDVPFN